MACQHDSGTKEVLDKETNIIHVVCVVCQKEFHKYEKGVADVVSFSQMD